MVRSTAWPLFLPGIDDSHCDRIHSFNTAVHFFFFFDDGYVEKHQTSIGLERILCGVLFIKKTCQSMERCTGRRYITD